MTIKELADLYAQSPQVKALAAAMANHSLRTIALQGLAASAAPMLFAAARHQGALLFVLDDEEEAGYFYHDLTQIMGEQTVLFFPATYRQRTHSSQRDAANEILRTEVLSRLTAINGEVKATTETTAKASSKAAAQATSETLFIVSHTSALDEPVVAQAQLAASTIIVRVGEERSPIALERQLLDLGFNSVDYVYEPGQFAVRGSIVDVFSYSGEYPFRIDFFGDEVDSIRTFELQSQLSRDRRTTAEIVPQFNDTDNDASNSNSNATSNTTANSTNSDATTDSDNDKSTSGDNLFHYLPPSAVVVFKHSDLAVQYDNSGIFRHVCLAASVANAPSSSKTAKTPSSSITAGTPTKTITCQMAPQPLFHKSFDLLADTLNTYANQSYKLYILADSPKQHERLQEILTSTPLIPVTSTLHAGFIDHQLPALFFTDHQIFDRFHRYSLRAAAARTGKIALTMKELQELEVGDYVVHVDLGIGRFAGLVRVPVGDTMQEVIRLVYQRGDKVDISIHSLHKISRYKNRDSEKPPTLSTLGTGAWERMKERTKTKIKDIARDLIRLYAARRHEQGFAFTPDTALQHELEASFLYEDTPDQLRTTREMKADMESPRPMDRLVCGDVGFGKTEIAVRAAFKAACDGKQVAILVPTTVLAYQHYLTFSKRLKDLPVTVDYLSRARTAKQTHAVLNDLATGKIDIIVGTHKLIGKSVRFKDLGLLIIDEEQKFGVAVKERLRKLKTNIDTLTLTATPIPRTLQFSLMGARDMSILHTPPPNRRPIHTELCEFGVDILADAVSYEMGRNGQTFVVCTRIAHLTEIATAISRRLPDARIAIANGQMPPQQLEDTLTAFIDHDYDVLVSTTIIENGIDIPNANTIIICDAHRYGLSDLHQMRGRVGRASRKAFCYLLAPPRTSLTTEARRRLEALETFSELGGGFHLAMQDLDIRGAGNLLGAEQSGFMEDIGYETYQKILSQAVTELKTQEFADLYNAPENDNNSVKQPANNNARLLIDTPEVFSHNGGDRFWTDDCAIESDTEAYLPDRYVPSDSERMTLYRQLATIQTDSALATFRSQLADRFGALPPEAEELLQTVPLRRMARLLGCEKLTLRRTQLRLQFISHTDSPFYRSSAFERIIAHLTNSPRTCSLREHNGKRTMTINNVLSHTQAANLLRTIAQ